MKTWSLGDVMDVLKHVERITRPPRRPNHDADEPLVGCPNPQDCREYDCAGDCSEAEEVSEPTTAEEWRDLLNRPTPCGVCGQTGLHICHREPGLTDDELVGVRGLLQERYGDPCTCPSWGNPSWPHRHDCPQQASPADLSTAGDSSPAVSDIPPSPAGEPPDLATWLEPAVQTMLGWHEYRFGHDTNCECGALGIFDWTDWQDHVAPLIAAHIAQALPDYPAAASPRHSFVAGYLAAVDLIENKAQADRDLADMLPEDHAVDPACLRKSTEWSQELARYMRAIAPK